MDFGMPFLLETQTIEDAAALCRELGLSFVELNLNFPQCGLGHMSAGRLNALKRKYGVYFTIHLDENLNVCDFNPLVSGAYLQTVRDCVRLGLAIGAPIINMHLHKGIYITLPDRRTYLFAQYEREYTQGILSLIRLCEGVIGGGPLLVAVENTDGFAAHEKTAVERLLQSPVFALTLDVGHSHAVGDIDLPFYGRHEGKLRHFHLHDASGKSNHLPLGTGQVDLPARLARARRTGARGVLETKTIGALKASILWLSQFREAQEGPLSTGESRVF